MDKHNENLLDDLLMRWEQLHERGQEVSAQELCREFPHLADELTRRIEAVKEMSWLDQPIIVVQNQSEPNTLPHSTPRILAGRYRLDALIAEGGFAHVWKAYDQELERLVAVKTPKLSRRGWLEEFVTEARKVAQLAHPNIVPIYDVGRDEDLCFLVFQFVTGGSLAELISGKTVHPVYSAVKNHSRNTPSPYFAANIVAETADALAYAHQQGFVHRDIKPDNILLDLRGHALLTDFGIAISTNQSSGSSPGTPRYMSPEQVEGKSVDARSDVYSLGVVLYELLAERLPYALLEPHLLRQQIIAGNLILEFSSDAPEELQRICRKLLMRNPEDRYASAGELATELRQWSLKLTQSLFLGKTEFDARNVSAADKKYAQALALDPGCMEAWRGRAACRFDSMPHGERLALPDKHLVFDPKDTEGFSEVWAEIYAERAKNHLEEALFYPMKVNRRHVKFSQAVQDLTQAIQCLPRAAFLYHERGSCYFNMKDYESAADDFAQAVQLEPTTAKNHMYRGLSLLALGNEEQAKLDFDVQESRLREMLLDQTFPTDRHELSPVILVHLWDDFPYPFWCSRLVVDDLILHAPTVMILRLVPALIDAIRRDQHHWRGLSNGAFEAKLVIDEILGPFLGKALSNEDSSVREASEFLRKRLGRSQLTVRPYSQQDDLKLSILERAIEKLGARNFTDVGSVFLVPESP